MKSFNKANFFKVIEQIAKQNFLTVNEIISIIDEAIKRSFHSKIDPDAKLEVVIDSQKQIFKLINHTKYVVDEKVSEKNKVTEINIKDAKKINKNIEIGGVVSEVVNFEFYSRTIEQLIRQLITQNVKEKRKEAIYVKYKDLKGKIIDAIVTTISNTHTILSLNDGITAFMPIKFQNPKIILSIGQKIKVYVEDVLKESKDAQIIVSNASKIFIKRILEMEVPEIADGIVEIVAISRIPGQRSKVAVKSNNLSVDPIGAIIGANGSRIKTIIDKLFGEKLDIIQWSANSKEFIANSLSPSKVISVLDKLDNNNNIIQGHVVIITPNIHQTLAIGKSGINARLAVELTNYRIDVVSIDEAKIQGIQFEWNGNVKEFELNDIESGVVIRKKRSRSNNMNNSFNHSNFINNEDDDAMLSFSEKLSESSSEEDAYEIDEYEFSKEDLDKMQNEFENFDNNKFNNMSYDEDDEKDFKET